MTLRFGLSCSAAIVILLLGAAVHAENGAPAAAGAGSVVRVRLAAPVSGHAGAVRGALMAASDAEVTVLPGVGEAPVVVPRGSIVGIDVKVRSGRRNAGALLGAAVGAVAGLVAGAAIDDNSGDDLFAANVLESGPVLALLAAPVGAVVGALVAPGEQWQELPSTDLRIGCGAGADAGVGIRVALGF